MMHKYAPNYYLSYRKINQRIRELLENENIENFEEKVSLNLVLAVYGAITQMKYTSDWLEEDIRKIRDDELLCSALDRVFENRIRIELNDKQWFIITLFKNRRYNLLKYVINIRKKCIKL